MQKKNGFTLIELMIIVGVIAIIMAIGIPPLLQAHRRVNEQMAVKALRAIGDAQVKYHGMQFADQDKDGVPEYADSIADLMETNDRATKQPLLTWHFAGGNSKKSSSGYYFQIEPGDADTNEVGWVAWAWPIMPGDSGRLTFQIDPFGEVLQTTTTVFNADGSQRPTKELAGMLKWEPLNLNKTDE